LRRHGTAAHVERAVRQFKRAKRNEALDAANERHEQRRVVWRMDDDLVVDGLYQLQR
jgi:hypothetical protein